MPLWKRARNDLEQQGSQFWHEHPSHHWRDGFLFGLCCCWVSSDFGTFFQILLVSAAQMLGFTQAFLDLEVRHIRYLQYCSTQLTSIVQSQLSFCGFVVVCSSLTSQTWLCHLTCVISGTPPACWLAVMSLDLIAPPGFLHCCFRHSL